MPTKKTKSVAVVKQEEPREILPQTLIAQAITQGVPVETMEKLMDLQDRWESKQARKAFDAAMAAFQADCPVIKKMKPGGRTNNGTVAYMYAPLDSIIQQTRDLIRKHGFSYQVKTVNTKDSLKAICIVKHVAGHQEESDFEVPSGGGTAIMSGPQKVAAALTFAKRYAFCNAFGIMTGDQDTDASPETTNEDPRPAAQRPPVKPKEDDKFAYAKGLIEKETSQKILASWRGKIDSSEIYTVAQKVQLLKIIDGKLKK